MHRKNCIGTVLLCLTVLVAKSGIVDAQGVSDKKLIVGTKLAAPFAIKNADGTWQGISIELWQTIATKLGLTYELREFDLKGLLDGVATALWTPQSPP